jgi:hypothetical protein
MAAMASCAATAKYGAVAPYSVSNAAVKRRLAGESCANE